MSHPSPDQSVPKIIGSRGSHDRIIEALKILPKGCALDAPAGRGTLAAFMKDLGYDVYCLDVDPGLLEVDLPFECADLNERLPYQDSFFDVVVCANALHRIAYYRTALREFARILKPGGVLLISVNNYANIAKRLKFLFAGSLSETNIELTHLQTIEDARANFRQALLYPMIHHAMEQAGFRIEEVRAQARRFRHYLLFPLAILAYLGSFLQSKKSVRRNQIQITRGAAINFGGKSIFIKATKTS